MIGTLDCVHTSLEVWLYKSHQALPTFSPTAFATVIFSLTRFSLFQLTNFDTWNWIQITRAAGLTKKDEYLLCCSNGFIWVEAPYFFSDIWAKQAIACLIYTTCVLALLSYISPHPESAIFCSLPDYPRAGTTSSMLEDWKKFNDDRFFWSIKSPNFR